MTKRKKHRILAWTALVFVILIVAILITWVVMTLTGRSSISHGSFSKRPNFGDAVVQGETLTPEEEAIWEEDWIRYDGGVYEYKDDIMTFLFMGIDVNAELSDKQTDLKSGQADALFLLVLVPDTKQIYVIGIDRNSMTTFQVYDKDGQLLHDAEGQIALAHGYGDGRELSASNTERAVSKFLYDLPIHGYCAINMAAIPTLNDAIDGVQVTVMEDIPVDKAFIKGNEVHLKGKQAYYYIKYRNTDIEGSARDRLNRQKQYLTAYISKAKQEFESDITIPVKLYQALSKYLVTDISLDEIVYLSQNVSGYHFQNENIRLIPGTTDTSGTYDEFYVDDVALKALMVEVFYRPVLDAEE
ncbi:MAG: LCP family protein [Lachnospiraceae bacterium]|nr:LCP family protein [Lachnospiraceae bacterium]